MTNRLSTIPLARRIDYTLIRPDATENDLRTFCREAAALGVRVISVNPVWAAFCARLLEGTRTGLDVYIAYPLGAATARMKMEEARDAVSGGATEISITVNMGAFLSGYLDYVEKEVAAVVRAVNGVPVKAIAETSLLSEDQTIQLAGLCAQAGAVQFQLATGFGRSVPDPVAVTSLRKAMGNAILIKAAGGIRTYADALSMLEAGAAVIGTSSAAAILAEAADSR